MTETARNRYADEPTRSGPPPSFGGGTPPVTTAETDSVAEWIKWHAVELAGIGGPLVLALFFSTWLVLLALPAAGLWASHGIRQARQVSAAKRGELTESDDTPGAISEENRS
jgi:hypothetical protein